ncbi:hypothetical protein L1987_41231 [Smallanthus sonchifolius]|uniref:Uncharacterized protein n=1 Tax=Smallanthus sonchifolius TaxID=185202 RepID=A0ACB9GVS2_9ASTR|nr:hypothetical protein L1987_41231 [Smallanthus sonchifolius]
MIRVALVSSNLNNDKGLAEVDKSLQCVEEVERIYKDEHGLLLDDEVASTRDAIYEHDEFIESEIEQMTEHIKSVIQTLNANQGSESLSSLSKSKFILSIDLHLQHTQQSLDRSFVDSEAVLLLRVLVFETLFLDLGCFHFWSLFLEKTAFSNHHNDDLSLCSLYFIYFCLIICLELYFVTDSCVFGIKFEGSESLSSLSKSKFILSMIFIFNTLSSLLTGASSSQPAMADADLNQGHWLLVAD